MRILVCFCQCDRCVDVQVRIQVAVYWDVTPSSDVGYKTTTLKSLLIGHSWVATAIFFSPHENRILIILMELGNYPVTSVSVMCPYVVDNHLKIFNSCWNCNKCGDGIAQSV
jgi:hypothetical protein